jgi:hypothetical protein
MPPIPLGRAGQPGRSGVDDQDGIDVLDFTLPGAVTDDVRQSASTQQERSKLSRFRAEPLGPAATGSPLVVTYNPVMLSTDTGCVIARAGHRDHPANTIVCSPRERKRYLLVSYPCRQQTDGRLSRP